MEAIRPLTVFCSSLSASDTWGVPVAAAFIAVLVLPWWMTRSLNSSRRCSGKLRSTRTLGGSVPSASTCFSLADSTTSSAEEAAASIAYGSTGRSGPKPPVAELPHRMQTREPVRGLRSQSGTTTVPL